MICSIADIRSDLSWPIAWAPSRAAARAIARSLGIPDADVLICEESLDDVQRALADGRVGAVPEASMVTGERLVAPAFQLAAEVR